MDQVKKFLEGYVEWLALGLAAVFLLYMVYANIVTEPVTVAVGTNPTVAPDRVAETIWNPTGQQVRAQINNPSPVPPMPVPDYVATTGKLFEVPATALAFGGVVPPASPVSNVNVPDVVVASNAAVVTTLATAAAMRNLVISQGHSNVGPGSPGAAAPGAGAPGAVVTAIDKQWVSVGGTIPSPDLAAAFAAAKIPPELRNTTILRVILFRQEKNAAGEWMDETTIQPPAIDALDPMPTTNLATAQPAADYKKYADANPVPILHPAFYPVLQGDVWYVPGTPSPNVLTVQMVEDKFVFEKYKTLSEVPDKWKDQWRAEKQRQNQANQPRPRTATPSNPGGNRGTTGGGNAGGGNTGGGSTGGGRSSGGGRGRGVVADPDRPTELADAAGGNGFGTPGGGMLMPVHPDPRSTGERDATPAAPVAPTAPAAPVDINTLNSSLPSEGHFDPSKQADIFAWCHDDTVQAGKTYRYRMQYMIYNPVARTVGLCKPQSLADVFLIPSETSEWTQPVGVESDANFYAVDNGAKGVKFDIFRWKNGNWQLQEVTAQAGDMIGSADLAMAKVDFTTGWTLLDDRTDPAGNVPATSWPILLTSDNGTVIRRDVNSDTHNSEFIRLTGLVNAARDKDKKNGGGPVAAAPAGGGGGAAPSR